MKKTISKIIISIIIASTILGLCPIILMASEGLDKVVYKDENGTYLIYCKDYLSSPFRFVITKNETKPDITSAISSIENGDENSNVAYVYDGAELNEGKGYLWIINDSDEFVVSGESIDINEAINDDIIDNINNGTIDIITDEVYESSKVEDGVTKNVTLGKIVLKDKDGQYEYQLMKIEEGSKAEELYNLAKDLEVEADSTYNKLALNKKYNDLYNSLKPTTGWNEVENSEILQPDNANKGDRYLVFLRNTANTSVEDHKFFVSDYANSSEYENADKVVTEVVKLPVTYDSIALIVALAIIIVAIIIVLILRKKYDKANH